MKNIMLSKKEFIPLLVILFCVCLYFIYEYFANQRTKTADLTENFQNSGQNNDQNMDSNKLHNLRMINLNLFTNFKNFLLKEKEYFRNDLDIANYFISKKFNLNRILKTSRIINGSRTYIDNTQMANFIDLRKSYLTGMIRDLNLVEENINQIERKNDFYIHFLSIINDLKFIYEDLLTYFVTENNNYLDINAIYDIFTAYNANRSNGSTNNAQVTTPVMNNNNLLNRTTTSVVTNNSETDSNLLVENINRAFLISREKIKNLSENIETTLNHLKTFLETEGTLDKTIRPKLVNLLNNRFNITLKMVVRNLSFDFIESIVQLVFTGQLSSSVITEKSNAARESNLVVREIIELIGLEISNSEDIFQYFKNSKNGSIIIIDNEYKYFNTVDKNTNTLINFCKKMKKLDKPTNNNFLFNRLSKEFIKKKNNQIKKLEQEIDQLMGEMTVTDAYNQDLYTLRTSDQAQHQINAIQKAKENIDSIGKFKINIK